jgi:phospholipid-transporting ATPase
MLLTIDLVVDGKSLTFALEKEVSKQFLELAIMCKAVICCKSEFRSYTSILKTLRRSRLSTTESSGR